MTDHPFTDADWHELKLAPLWILAAVAGADGKIDESERASHLEAISTYATNQDPLVRQAFAELEKDFETLWLNYLGDPRSAAEGITAVSTVLARPVTTSDVLPFKQALLELGHTVAEASGTRLPLASKRSRPERNALHLAAEALGLPPTA
ncbi:MAG: hypothetical protein AB7N24_19935 [Dehalococcoidia bacterium]